MTELVDLNRLSPTTKHALEQYAERYHYDEWLRSFIQPQWLTWLIELLKAETDTEELFPNGKWATIQRMQELLTMAVKAEIANRNAP